MQKLNKINKVALAYFSPTLTTRRTLKSIIKPLMKSDNGDRGIQIEELDLTRPESRKDPLTLMEGDVDLLIFGVPCYEGRVPEVMRDYLQDVALVNIPTVAVVVYGNVILGKSLSQLTSLLSDHGAKVFAVGSFIGEHSFTDSFVKVATDRPDTKDIFLAEQLGKEINLVGIDHPQISLADIPGKLSLLQKILPEGFMSSFGYPSGIIPEKCTKCKTCARICPVGAINPDTLEIDREKCIHCQACVKRCPEGAREIKFKWKFIVDIFFKKPSERRLESWYKINANYWSLSLPGSNFAEENE